MAPDAAARARSLEYARSSGLTDAPPFLAITRRCSGSSAAKPRFALGFSVKPASCYRRT